MRIVDFHVKKDEIGVVCVGESLVIVEDGYVGNEQSLDVEAQWLSVWGGSLFPAIA
jgi:hypothetical protein